MNFCFFLLLFLFLLVILSCSLMSISGGVIFDILIVIIVSFGKFLSGSWFIFFLFIMMYLSFLLVWLSFFSVCFGDVIVMNFFCWFCWLNKLDSLSLDDIEMMLKVFMVGVSNVSVCFCWLLSSLLSCDGVEVEGMFELWVCC